MEKRMLCVTAAIICTILISRRAVQAQLDCKSDLVTETVQCYKNRNLEVSYMPNVATDPDVIIHALTMTSMDPLVQCRFPVKYKAAVFCVMGVLEGCADPPSMANSLPDLQRLSEGMDAVCNKYYTMNADCIKQNHQRIMDCTQTILKDLLLRSAEIQSYNTDQFTCLAADINYDCMIHVIGQACDEFSLNSFAMLSRRYLVARVCMGPENDPGRSGRTRYVQTQNGDDDSNSATAIITTPLLPFIAIAGLVTSCGF